MSENSVGGVGVGQVWFPVGEVVAEFFNDEEHLVERAIEEDEEVVLVNGERFFLWHGSQDSSRAAAFGVGPGSHAAEHNVAHACESS